MVWLGMYQRRLAVVCCVTGILSLIGCQDNISDTDVQAMPLAEVRRTTDSKSDSWILLDARPAEDYAAGHLPGAINVPMTEIKPEKGTLRSDLAAAKGIIVYGNDPGDTYAIGATKRLLRAGQKGARLYSGGVREWKNNGLKLDGAGAAGADSKQK